MTGGAGYIGSHVCKALYHAGFLPITYDNLSTGHAWAVQWGPLEVGDLRDAARLTEVFRKWQPAAVLHFAALAEVGQSMQDPLLYYHHNLTASLSLFHIMRTFEVNTIVFSSSCAIYGLPQEIPIPENHPQQPINPYGHSKIMGEQILHDLQTIHGWKVAILRYFNAAGADAEGQIGEAHHPESHLIPRVIQTALGLYPHLEIFGEDYPTQDGTAIRDYIHVEDLASAHRKALEKLLQEPPQWLPLNLGTGQGYSIRHVIQMVEKISQKKIPCRSALRRPGDPPVLIAHAQRARDLLEWQPLHSLESMIASALTWHMRPFS